MRWRGLVIVAALAAAPSAHAATLNVSSQLFSPEHATLQLRVQLTVPRQVGVSLVTLRGRSCYFDRRIVFPSSGTVRLAYSYPLTDAGLLPPPAFSTYTDPLQPAFSRSIGVRVR